MASDPASRVVGRRAVTRPPADGAEAAASRRSAMAAPGRRPARSACARRPNHSGVPTAGGPQAAARPGSRRGRVAPLERRRGDLPAARLPAPRRRADPGAGHRLDRDRHAVVAERSAMSGGVSEAVQEREDEGYGGCTAPSGPRSARGRTSPVGGRSAGRTEEPVGALVDKSQKARAGRARRDRREREQDPDEDHDDEHGEERGDVRLEWPRSAPPRELVLGFPSQSPARQGRRSSAIAVRKHRGGGRRITKTQPGNTARLSGRCTTDPRRARPKGTASATCARTAPRSSTSRHPGDRRTRRKGRAVAAAPGRGPSARRAAVPASTAWTISRA